MGKSGRTNRQGGRTAYWIAKLRAGPLSEFDRRRFEAWRAAHPTHHAAVESSLRAQREAAGRQRRALQARGERRRNQSKPTRAPALLRRLTQRREKILFVVLAVSLAAVFLPYEEAADYRTAPGAQASFALSDGSVVFMNTDTALNVLEGEGPRRIDLLRGEADVIVMPGSSPMEITVAGAMLSAAGGRFLLRKDRRGITLSVIDGMAVLKPLAGGVAATEIEAGDTVMLSEDGTAIVPSDTMIDAIAAWQEGAVVFDSTPLDQALRQVSRYRPGRLVILSDRLARREVLGRYSLKDPDALFAMLLAEGGGGKLEFFDLLTLIY